MEFDLDEGGYGWNPENVFESLLSHLDEVPVSERGPDYVRRMLLIDALAYTYRYFGWRYLRTSGCEPVLRARRLTMESRRARKKFWQHCAVVAPGLRPHAKAVASALHDAALNRAFFYDSRVDPDEWNLSADTFGVLWQVEPIIFEIANALSAKPKVPLKVVP